MLRITLLEIVLLCVPFALFFAYRAVTSARRRAHPEGVDDTPVQLLFLAGAVLSIAVLVISVLMNDGAPSNTDRVYIPPHTEGGKIVDGRFISREEAIERGLIDVPPADRTLDSPP